MHNFCPRVIFSETLAFEKNLHGGEGKKITISRIFHTKNMR